MCEADRTYCPTYVRFCRPIYDARASVAVAVLSVFACVRRLAIAKRVRRGAGTVTGRCNGFAAYAAGRNMNRKALASIKQHRSHIAHIPLIMLTISSASRDKSPPGRNGLSHPDSVLEEIQSEKQCTH